MEKLYCATELRDQKTTKTTAFVISGKPERKTCRMKEIPGK